jgi:ubiquinone/menaquinone biosynthesis C-methylase UbiE
MVLAINMTRPRIPMKYGTTGKTETENYDLFMRFLRDKNWLNSDEFSKAGISKGVVLQIGHGPGYTGLEWLKHTEGTHLAAFEVSPEMIEIAKRNLKEYPGLEKRIKYVQGNAEKMEFDNNSFDGVFCNGELHEWPNPIAVFNEINRVLKPGGKYFIRAHRRDINPLALLHQKITMRKLPKSAQEDFMTITSAAYIYEELETILEKSNLKGWNLEKESIRLTVSGEKPAL